MMTSNAGGPPMTTTWTDTPDRAGSDADADVDG
jgi:hypothetical protein